MKRLKGVRRKGKPGRRTSRVVWIRRLGKTWELRDWWFPRLAKQLKRRLWGLLAASALLHATILLLAGSWVVYRHVIVVRKEIQLEAPPQPERSVDPLALKYRVQIREQQRRSGRPHIQPRLSASHISDLSLPQVNPTAMTSPLPIDLVPFNLSGIGKGLGSGFGVGGLGLSASPVHFFGITDRGERIAFLIDISLSMIEDDKGGEPGFEKLKGEINDMIDLLSPGTFFNLILFGNQVDILEPQMILASDDNKRRAREFLGPYLRGVAESLSASGNRLANYTPSIEGVPASGGSTRLDLAITAAFEQNADILFVISDGKPRIIQRFEGRELKEYEEKMAEYRKELEKSADEEDDAEEMQKAIQQAMRERAAMAARRRERGLPPKISEEGGGLVIRRQRESDRPTPPQGPGPWTDSELIEHIERLGKAVYKEKGRPMPRINCIAFACGMEDEDFMRMLAREFHGKFKRAKARAKPIEE